MNDHSTRDSLPHMTPSQPYREYFTRLIQGYGASHGCSIGISQPSLLEHWQTL
jgi:hypothetical protein